MTRRDARRGIAGPTFSALEETAPRGMRRAQAGLRDRLGRNEDLRGLFPAGYRRAFGLLARYEETLGGRRGLLAVTDRRIIFAADSRRWIAVPNAAITASLITHDGRSAELWLSTPAGEVAFDSLPPTAADGLASLLPGPEPLRRALPSAERSPLAAMLARAGVATATPVLLFALALAVWVISLAAVDIRDVGDLGLVTALPASAYVSLVLVACGAGLGIGRHARRTWLVVLQLATVVFMLHGATALVEETPSFSVTWRHAGVADHILASGHVDAGIDAYFNWPGFFFLLALATDLAGLGSPLGLASWAPVVLNLLYLAPLVVIARAATPDPRVAWLAVWFFVITNWIGQDYLSPQGLTYFLYLAVVGLVLLYFRTERGLRYAIELPTIAPWQRAALLLGLVALIAAAVPSHQLTPFAIIASLTALVFVRHCYLRGLPVIAFLLTVSWISFMTIAYLEGHFDALAAQIGEVESTVSSNVGGRVSGSSDHQLIVYTRLAMTAFFWSLALAGALWTLRRGRGPFSHAVLALTPFGLLLLQPYGGEILLRVYLFSLPFTCVFAAALVRGVWERMGPNGPVVAVSLTSVLLLGGFLFTRYGNHEIALFTKDEVAAVNAMYRLAPDGSLLTAPSPNLPWQHREYALHDHEILRRQERPNEPDGPPPTGARLARELADYMRSKDRPASFLVVTRSVRNYDHLFGTASPWGTAAGLERAVRSSALFSVAFANRDAAVYRLRKRARGRRQ